MAGLLGRIKRLSNSAKYNIAMTASFPLLTRFRPRAASAPPFRPGPRLCRPGFADNLPEVQRLIKQGQLPRPSTRSRATWRKQARGTPRAASSGSHPHRDEQAGRGGRRVLKLTEDYPELPEPYNNLAVLYAQQKQYDKARTALEMAIRTHPSYAIAYENLGDVYAKLASQAYDKALQLDSANSTAQNKMALIRDLISTSAGKRPQAPAAPRPHRRRRPPGASAGRYEAAPAAAPAPRW